ncbi:MAG TPA: phospholipase C, phosphocholine-specific [Candidatus Limnocylindria bacterium]|nr:phospholipase C, phosphocholine-specific [Candidatus Limnocylindria bacterium]
MDNRREFVKKAAFLSGAAGLFGALPASIQRALAINPEPGSTYLDAEHVVILMQENRSFDHTYGTLQGVRGFNDPRAITLPNQNPVWLQSNAAGETYAPFRLNIKETKSTWVGSLPHSWTNQVDARNHGRHNGWIDAKPSGHHECAKMPLTLGFYNRDDIPFYYALADAFTVCDQHFCSSLTGTTPNRLYLWTGTVREKPDADSPANVRNENVDYGYPARWTTFPERLEAVGVSWKIYQNELSLDSGFEGEQDGWLSNFTDNPIEWFEQYHVKFNPSYHAYMVRLVKELPGELEALQQKAKAATAGSHEATALAKEITHKTALLETAKVDVVEWAPENFQKLSQREQNIHAKAFTTNIKDPAYRELATLKYKDGDTEREVQVPKGDTLFQFRDDVKNGKLPTVSWIVAPENFSDHPGAPWYGAWYLSEVLDILTQNPEVWKKTIFVLTYDENDGYFDHVPPFVSPHPKRHDTGQVSKNIDPSVEFVELAQDLKRKPKAEARESSIGLGYRVPLVIASPWSRGGCVCSQVFDHTSVLQMMEVILSRKLGRKIEESNISAWRRTVCGDLSSVFKPYTGDPIVLPKFLEHDAVIEGIHRAKFKKLPDGYHPLSSAEIGSILKDPTNSPLLPHQEPGIRPASPLPYELYVDGKFSKDKQGLVVSFEARNTVFGKKSAGSPFHAYVPGKYRSETIWEEVKTWAYAVAAGDRLEETFPLSAFENEKYHLRVHGPNGFYREFIGSATDPAIRIQCEYERSKSHPGELSGNFVVKLSGISGGGTHQIEIRDNAYKAKVLTVKVGPDSTATGTIETGGVFGWYDVTVRLLDTKNPFERRFAGHVDTGKPSFTDPAMGRVVG